MPITPKTGSLFHADSHTAEGRSRAKAEGAAWCPDARPEIVDASNPRPHQPVGNRQHNALRRVRQYPADRLQERDRQFESRFLQQRVRKLSVPSMWRKGTGPHFPCAPPLAIE